MKIYTRTVHRIADGELIDSDSFEYEGPIASCDPITATIAAVSTLGGALISSHASQSAANTQAAATQQASNEQLQMYQQSRGDLAPWMNSGTMAMGGLNAFMGVNPDGSVNPNAPGLRSFTPADLTANLDPSYGFMKSEGENAILDNASALGGIDSGKTRKDLMTFGENLASQEYGNAWNRWTAQQGSIFSRLMGISSLGESAAAGVGNLGATTAGNYGNLVTSGANAQAAGTVGAANAYTGGINSLFQSYMLSQLFKGGGAPAGP